jgi:ppGpp synthetase/RelA/SpoT-type nucleotidyltranferase
MSSHHVDSRNSILIEFIEQFKREYDYYAKCAEESARMLKSALADAGIRCIVSSRAKSPEKVLRKIRNRDLEKKYKHIEDVRKDIVDLAGVRVALYFPSDRQKLEKIIQDHHDVLVRKTFPDSGRTKGNKRFDGYHADHYRVTLKAQGIDSRYCEVPIEIQVGSLLMHAWSEVEHDLIYKPDTGDVLPEEHAILDEVNGLVIAGEIALERLHNAIQARVTSAASQSFANKYDLASYIYTKLEQNSSVVKNISNLDAIWGMVSQIAPEKFEETKKGVERRPYKFTR